LYKNWQETFCSSKSMNADQKTFVKCQSGFALVVALSLMAFTLLLILSITSLIQVETINASRALDQLRARENARLGLMVGLGDLQKFVGADLIVTATADAIGEPNVDYNINAKHWTGRWTSDGNGGVLANPIWLVSGDTPDPLAGAGASSVAIFPATTDDAEVRVPLMPINGQNNTNSSYAYWLTDESNKARINLDSISSLMTYLTTDSERQNISEAYQPFPAQDKIFDVLDPIKNTDTATFSRIFNRLQVPLVEPSIDAQDAYHNFTLASQSVLTDMINGGLKQNLTGRTLIQMNNLLSEADYLDDNYLGGDYLSHFNIDPLTGNALENNGNADTPLNPQPRFNSSNELIRSTVADFYDYRTNQIDSSDGIAEPVRNIMPVISEVSFRLGAFHTQSDTKHRLRFHADVEFWNPYPFPIRMPADSSSNRDRCFIIMLVPSVIDETGADTEQMILSIRNRNLPDELHTNLFDFDEDLGSGSSGGGSNSNTLNETVLQSWMEIEDVVLQPGEVYHATTRQSQGLAREIGGYILRPGGDPTKAEDYMPDIDHDYHKWSWHTTATPTYPVLEPDHLIDIDLRMPENGVTMRIINYSSSLTNSTSPIYEDDTNNDWAEPVWELRNIYKGSNPPRQTLQGDQYSRSSSGGYTLNNFNIGFHFRLADELVFGATPDASDLALRFDLRQPVWDYDDPVVQEIVEITEENPFNVSSLANLYDGTDVIADASTDTHNGTFERAFLYNAPAHEPLSVGALHRLPLSFETVDYDVDGDGTDELVQKRIGTPWGGDLNQAFDKYFYTGAPVTGWTDDIPLGVAHLRPTSELSNAEVRQQDAAEHLLVAGGFNINSTSTKAWEAMLSRTIYDWEYGDTNGVNPSNSITIDLENAFLNLAESTDRASEAVGAIANEATLNSGDTVVDGRLAMRQAIRRLSDTQITNLAESVVDALDIHFASNSLFSDVATFVNAGILEQAIMNSGINGSIARYSPAYISQNLILEMLAPYLTVRADTFTIKSYGTSTNPVTGKPIAEIICEATVQRLPQRVDGDASLIQEEATTNGNTFGRRFAIVDINWSSVN
jgi:hypothetical protein